MIIIYYSIISPDEIQNFMQQITDDSFIDEIFNNNELNTVLSEEELQAIENYNNKIDCPICLSNTSINKKLKCSHIFCKKCIYNWLKTKNSCPVCRKNVKE